MSKPESVLLVDIGHGTWHALLGSEIFAFSLERNPNGRLTDLCRERLTASLRGFVSQKNRGGLTAWCAINARGVSMRKFSLPASAPDETQRVLRLQIETEFPLSPEELAWGTTPLGSNPGRQDLLVVAVKKDVVEDYRSIFAACGITATFTLAALARLEAQKAAAGSGAVLDIGRAQSELLIFDGGSPVSVRTIAWGGDNITRAIQEKLSVSHDDAEKLKLALDQPGAVATAQTPLVENACSAAAEELARVLKTAPIGTRLCLTGKSARGSRLAGALTSELAGAATCESLERLPLSAPTAAIAGLTKLQTGAGISRMLVLESGGGHALAKPSRPAVWKWAAAAVFLVFATLLFPYGEAIVMKPFLEKKLAKLESERGRLAVIDQELDFLKFVKQNQPPYIDAMYLIARSAPGGTKLDSLAMGRHQETSMSLHFGNSQQVSDFRTKLIKSGWFSNVVVEEQNPPGPDRTVAVRMTAALLPAETRTPIPVETNTDISDANGWGGPEYSGSQPAPMMMPSPGSAPGAMPLQVMPGPPPSGPGLNPSGTPVRRVRRTPVQIP